MPGTPVRPDQFKVTDLGVEHLPTGYKFTAHSKKSLSGNARLGLLGNKLPTGEDYRPHEVEAMANQLWLEQVNSCNT